MPINELGGLRAFQFEQLTQVPVVQAIFSRHGGVSKGPFAELNVGSTVGDELENVSENMRRTFAAAGRPLNSIFDSWLVHGTGALVAGEPRPVEWGKPPQGDIILTNKVGVTLFMRYADCVPIILVDPLKRAIALAHAGWRGTLQRVAAKAVDELKTHYGSQPQDVLAGIGPAISVDHYQVGSDVADAVRVAFGESGQGLLPMYDGSAHFDLVGSNKLVLEEAGVSQIEVANICTFTNSHDWFSHRASNGKTGRFGALLALQ